MIKLKLSRTTSTATMNALNNTSFLQFTFWDSANTIGSKVCVSCLNASQAAQVLVARFLPLCDQICIRDFLIQAIIVKLSADGFSAIKQIVNVSGFLMMNFEDGPE